MLNYVELQVDGRKASAELTPLTFLVGSGKSLFIHSIYKILSNIGSKIPKIYSSNFVITIKIKEKTFSLQRNGNIYRQVLEEGSKRVVFEYGSVRGSVFNRVVEPFELSIKDANVVMPFIEVSEHVSILAEEEVEEVNKFVDGFRRAFSLRAVLLGPYIDPETFYDASKGRRPLRPDGGNLVGVLASLALTAPDVYDKLRGDFRKKGIKLAVGLSKRGLLAGVAYIGRAKVPISRLPCSLKAALTIAAAVSTRPDLLLLDNFDYCFNEKLTDILSKYLEEQASRGQVIAELHKPDLAELFKVQYKSLLSLSL
ncbi:MAG: DNA-binding protein [Thermoproteus sp.]